MGKVEDIKDKHQCLKATVDSDSGHGRTSSSSSASVSSNDEPQIKDHEESDTQDADQFVDALENDFQHTNSIYPAFNDASATINDNKTTQNGTDKLETRELKMHLDETAAIVRLALNNEFVRALDLCSPRAHEELYASLANATLSFLRAVLTMEHGDLKAAVHGVGQSFEVSSAKRRKSSTASMITRLIYRPNYNSYTDDEIHAELVHAESLLLSALISFISDQSLICLVKGAFKIRTCYQRYKECLYIMENRTDWDNDDARKHFESGVRMGHGIFNLLMSYLPRRVLRFLEYVGFSGNRAIGVEELDKSVALNDGLRSILSALVILTYHTYVDNLFGLGNYDSARVEQLNNSLLGDFPNGAFFLLFRGRYHQMQGNLEAAIDNFQRCIEAQDEWKQFHAICHWEMMWCYAVQMDWPKAAHYSDLLRKQSKWSPASYTYQYATFLYAQLVEDQRKGLIDAESAEYKEKMQHIVDIMKEVPELRIRYAGKTIPAEKFAITRSAKFLSQNNRLTLPAIEFLYIWNIFATLKNSPQQVEKLQERIDQEIEIITKYRAQQIASRTREDAENSDEEGDNDDDEDDDQVDNWSDDLALVLLLRGMCAKHLGKLNEAEESFKKVIDMESSIKVDTFVVPHTTMELAVLKLSQKQYDEAKIWAKQARSNYTGYLLETIVHFRLHAANRVMRIELGDTDLQGRQSYTETVEDANGQTINTVEI